MTTTTSEPRPERYLDPSEALLFAGDVNSATAATLTGSIDDTLLDRAYDTLAAGEAILRATITRDDTGPLMRASVDRPPTLEVRDGGTAEYWRQISAGVQPERSLSRLVRIRDGEDSIVMLLLHHAIADATGAMSLFQRLWELYTALSENRPVDRVVDDTLPPSAEGLMPKRWQPRTPEESLDAVVVPAPPPPSQMPDPSKQPYVHRLMLAEAETDRLLALSSRTRTSLHTLVSAAILTATARAGLVGDRKELVCRSPINLRHRVDQPVGPTEATNFISGAMTRVVIDGEPDLVEMAVHMKEQMRAALDREEPQRLCTDPKRALAFLLQPCDATVSNVGQAPELSVPAANTVTDIRLMVNRYAMSPTYIVMTQQGRLSVEFVFSPTVISESELAGLAEEVRGLLVGIGS